MNIGIIGYGIVGKAIENGFKDKTTIFINDPAHDGSFNIDHLVKKCEFIFVGVPTPMKKVMGGPADTSIIDSVIHNLYGACLDNHKCPIIIIKSAVDILSVARYIKEYAQLRLVVSPEYLTDKNSIDDFLHEELLLLGGNPIDTAHVAKLFEKFSACRKDRPVGQCDIMGAALLKYMENSFLALKVTYMNQFYDLAKAAGVTTDWHDLMEMFHYDTRMGNSHFDVPGPDGDKGWGGKCLPKDINTIIYAAKKYGVDLDIMEKVWEINLRIRKNIDWADIDGAVVDEQK